MQTDTDVPGKAPLIRRIGAHPVLVGGAALAVVALVAFVLVWFQPQALLFDRVVDEDFPTVTDVDAAPGDREAPADSATSEQSATPEQSAPAVDGPDPQTDPQADGVPKDDEDQSAVSEPVLLAAGTFSSRNRYTVEGQASVFELEDGSRVLRLEDFSSTNGPDLFVYLTAADEADDDADLDADHVDLGVLRGNIGDQNYAIPEDVDLDDYDTVVIWCRRFTVGFGAADLGPAD